jgi:serine/threonine protein kinase
MSKQFLAAVGQSQLVDEVRLAGWLHGQAEGLPPEQLAERMIQEGLLTRFQARQLLRGRWQGFRIGGKYRVLELLGAGGMGRVFLCEHVRLRTLVALKVLPPENLEEPAALERFNREARAAANLVHPNIVRAFDIDEDGQFHYLVMEYVPGQSLQQLVARNGPFDVALACECVRQSALGLQYAHDNGLVHRDIKPGNILLDQNGAIKILDLGLARFGRDSHDRLTEEKAQGSILGTADYLAPEQAVSSQVTIQADIYSLGATFYFLLAGRAPFEDGSLAQKMIWHQMREPAALRSVRPEVPPEVEAVVSRMMAKELSRRYALPSEVAAAVAPWAGGPRPLAAADLPSWCPAVCRLLANLPAAAEASRGCQPPEPASAQAGASTRQAPAPTLAAPHPSVRRRRARWALVALLALLLIGGALLGQRLLFPPLTPPGPADVKDFDPFAGIDRNKPIAAVLAQSLLGQERVVLMPVRDRRRREGRIFFYSEKVKERDHGGRKKLFTVLIGPTALGRFKSAGIADPYNYYQGALIEVRGTIQYLPGSSGRPGIEVKGPEQIRIVASH